MFLRHSLDLCATDVASQLFKYNLEIEGTQLEI